MNNYFNYNKLSKLFGRLFKLFSWQYKNFNCRKLPIFSGRFVILFYFKVNFYKFVN